MTFSSHLARFSAIVAVTIAVALVGIPAGALAASPAAASAAAKTTAGARAKAGRAHFGLSRHNRALGRSSKRRKIVKHNARNAAASALPPGVIFQANHLSDFWLRQSAPGAITEVPDPAGSGQSVFKMTVGDGDVYPITPTENPRAEMLSPATIRSGDEFWWSTKFFLPADFPSSVPGWMNLMQGPYGAPFDGTPPFHIEVNGNHIQWARNNTYKWDVPWQMPLVKNTWVSVMVHERFAGDGFLELWIDGQPITFFGGGTYNPNHVAPTQRLATATMDSSNGGNANSIYLQSYRQAGMFPSVTSYAGPLTIGTTRASVGG